MIRKSAAPTPGYIRVLFELPSCLWADRIFIVGDFNQWHESATPMHQGRDGVWRATVDLPLGSSYEFRYLIDGNWTSDSHADGFAQNSFGVSNSIIHARLPVSAILDAETEENAVPSRSSAKGTHAPIIEHQLAPQSIGELGKTKRPRVTTPRWITA